MLFIGFDAGLITVDLKTIFTDMKFMRFLFYLLCGEKNDVLCSKVSEKIEIGEWLFVSYTNLLTRAANIILGKLIAIYLN